MFLLAVSAGDVVRADRVSVFSFHLVDVGGLALFTFLVVFGLLVRASALAAPDWAVGVDLVAELPAAVALDEVNLLGPSGDEAGDVEEEQR